MNRQKSEFCNNAEWRGKVLRPGFAFPYRFGLPGEKREEKIFQAWPVDTLDGVKSLLWLCQSANVQILSIATAGRASELGALGRDPLVRLNGDDLLGGVTFKETDAPLGSNRQWPLSHHAVEAVRRQQSLLGTLGETGPRLWCTGSNNTTGVLNPYFGIRKFGESVSTHENITLGHIDGGLSPHRYRKTMSRLVGLALEGASGVLYDVLGHTDMDVTLGYMLADPEFQEDADCVRREVQNVRRKEIAAELDECGGPAAHGLRIARDELRARGIREDLGDDDPELLLALFPTLQQVGPHRYCTADGKQKGLCSKIIGVRDVGACNARCLFRLERAAARKDRKDAIDSALDFLSGDVNVGMRVFYQGQIIANLAPFEETLDDFTEDARLYTALQDCDPHLLNPLPEATRGRLDHILGAK